ncbi:chemotaxis protein CheW [Thermoleptolyngbya sp. C42_A2020_037]|uniref:chemotaxis protein CheW n=1 Tax=Thermoleptolyngbya sp. C42_A2020_037 TaxID=2747799 RepID=UPI0019EF558E|nr:chemotaxis protein CheW [Thermoleptolyngbya sp. C42_A2020_037]MBF2085032.1 chemotaxis protein CheW [Thermoleptolyngbya sp. C42_A2020_037]
MALLNSLRALRSKPVEATRQLLVFPLRQERFALPLAIVHRVIEIDRLYAQQDGTETAIALAHNENIPVLNIQQRIFVNAQTPAKRIESDTQIDTQHVGSQDAANQQSSTFATPQYLILVYNLQGDITGLLIDGPPTLQRFAESAFQPLSGLYQQEGGIRCVSGLVLPRADCAPIFLLNLAQVMQSQTALSGSM